MAYAPVGDREELGAIAPMGFFDPLSLSASRTPSEIKKWREAELKHGRVAMLASLGILIGENPSLTPFFKGQIVGPAAFQFQQADGVFPAFWALVLFPIALLEGQSILRGWESPRETKARKDFKVDTATLKDEYINGGERNQSSHTYTPTHSHTHTHTHAQC